MSKVSSIKSIKGDLLVTPALQDLPSFLKKIESKWKLKLSNRFDREQFVLKKKELGPIEEWSPRYILAMFPYPSGRLHLGHVRTYTSSDILARYSKMMSKNSQTHSNLANYSHVINPMGFDSFGLPAENAARERGMDPAVWTNSNIRTMKKQLDDLCFQFDWREATSNPSFYRWTQDLFLRLMNANLAYKSYARVNWDPVDNTVLADEQVDDDGRSWRSGAIVERRYYKQWFIKANAFTDAIYRAENINVDSWRDVLAIQRHWIGRPSGWLFYLPLQLGSSKTSDILVVFTKFPELFLNSATKILISNDHWLNKVYHISEKEFITNPFTHQRMDVNIVDDHSMLPESQFATLEINPANQDCLEDDQLSTSDNLKRNQVILKAKLNGFGGYFTSDKYRDWLVSRQRFWGTPIPVVDCRSCGFVAVERQSLPVLLPRVDFKRERRKPIPIDTEFNVSSPLQELAPEDWLNVECPSCGQNAHRECETFDTLFDSSWYFLRYSTSPSDDKPFDSTRVRPVWSYIGGKEHAAMHLFYARFITHFLHSEGQIEFNEPFSKLLVQGVVKSKTYSINGRYLSPEELEKISDKSELTVAYEKMSKSKGNGVDPQDLLDRYGIDATRFCLMNYANPRSERLWRTEQEEFKDVLMHFRRVILTVEQYIQAGQALIETEGSAGQPKIVELEESERFNRISDLVAIRNRSYTDAIFYLQEAQQFRQFISAHHHLLNSLRNNIKSSIVYSKEFAESLAGMIIMLNPVTPHLSEELWQHFCKCRINPLRMSADHRYDTSLQASDQPWPMPNHDISFDERSKYRPEAKQRTNKRLKLNSA